MDSLTIRNGFVVESKVTLKTLPTGSIDIVHNGTQMFLQFNCSCDDALPYCKGMCCAYRPMFNAEVFSSEASMLDVIHPPHAPEKAYLNYDTNTGQCVYHGAAYCTIHQTKPSSCRISHCSPQGQGEDILVRQNGWLLLPTAVIGAK